VHHCRSNPDEHRAQAGIQRGDEPDDWWLLARDDSPASTLLVVHSCCAWLGDAVQVDRAGLSRRKTYTSIHYVLPMCCMLRVVAFVRCLSVLKGCCLAPFCSFSAAFATPSLV
jgi:hypothetical protein